MLPSARYQETQTATASKERVLLLLLAGARKQMFLADGELALGRAAQAATPVRKAIDIVHELRSTLDPSKAPELCTMLDDVYGFVLTRLYVSLRGDRAALDDARRTFNPIAEAFEEAVARAGRPQP